VFERAEEQLERAGCIDTSFIVRLINGGWPKDLSELTINVPMVCLWRWAPAKRNRVLIGVGKSAWAE